MTDWWWWWLLFICGGWHWWYHFCDIVRLPSVPLLLMMIAWYSYIDVRTVFLVTVYSTLHWWRKYFGVCSDGICAVILFYSPFWYCCGGSDTDDDDIMIVVEMIWRDLFNILFISTVIHLIFCYYSPIHCWYDGPIVIRWWCYSHICWPVYLLFRYVVDGIVTFVINWLMMEIFILLSFVIYLLTIPVDEEWLLMLLYLFCCVGVIVGDIVVYFIVWYCCCCYSLMLFILFYVVILTMLLLLMLCWCLCLMLICCPIMLFVVVIYDVVFIHLVLVLLIFYVISVVLVLKVFFVVVIHCW
jgi:hypothetical protein